jgi:hypothetical protein
VLTRRPGDTSANRVRRVREREREGEREIVSVRERKGDRE